MADLLTEVCHDVSVEPTLQSRSGEYLPLPSTSTEQDARLDVAASGFFGGRWEKAFFDVGVFSPLTNSNQGPLLQVYRKEEADKQRKCGRRILDVPVEKSLLVAIALSCCGGAGAFTTVVLKRLASLIAVRRNVPYSIVMSLLRSWLSLLSCACA